MPHVCWSCVFATDRSSNVEMSHSDLASSLGFGFPQTHFGGFYCQYLSWEERNKNKHQSETKNVFIKNSPELNCISLSAVSSGIHLTGLRGSMWQVFLSISLVRLLRAPSYKESSKSSQVESIYSMLCRWQECWPGRCVAVWVQWMLRWWWVSWVQTQAGPLLTLRCLAFITQMGEGFSLL